MLDAIAADSAPRNAAAQLLSCDRACSASDTRAYSPEPSVPTGRAAASFAANIHEDEHECRHRLALKPHAKHHP